jgi:hypothetical protein
VEDGVADYDVHRTVRPPVAHVARDEPDPSRLGMAGGGQHLGGAVDSRHLGGRPARSHRRGQRALTAPEIDDHRGVGRIHPGQ